MKISPEGPTADGVVLAYISNPTEVSTAGVLAGEGVSLPETVSSEQDDPNTLLAKRVEAGLFAAQLLNSDLRSQLKNDQLVSLFKEGLTKQARGELEQVVREGIAAKEALVTDNINLVHACVAKVSANHRVGKDDLMQAGALALTESVEEFDYTKGSLGIFATVNINRALKEARGQQYPAPLTRTVMSAVDKMRRAQATLVAKFMGREPTLKEIASEMETTPAKLAEIKLLAHPGLSLDAPYKEGPEGESEPLGNLIPAQRSGSPFDQPEDALVLSQVDRVLDEIAVHSEEGRYVAQAMRLRFSGVKQTHEQVAKALGISRERSRTLERVGIAILQRKLGFKISLKMYNRINAYI